jgi:hypothetical protein
MMVIGLADIVMDKRLRPGKRLEERDWKRRLLWDQW